MWLGNLKIESAENITWLADLVVSCLGIGGSSAGGSYGAVTEEETVEMITEGVRGGVNYVDTAPWYRDSQRIIGKVRDDTAYYPL